MSAIATIGMVIFFLLMAMAVLTSYYLRSRKVMLVHETGTSIIFGAIVGLIISISSSSEELKGFVTFKKEVFMLVLLPQIIFESGYNMRRKAFFKNAPSFLLFAFVGTLISMFTISFGLMLFVKIEWIGVNLTPRDCLIFGSLISATDPVSVLAIFTQLKVNRSLFANVFGESVMNDAIAIVLVQTFLKFHQSSELTAYFIVESIGLFLGIFLGSIAIGSLFGFLTALLLKHIKIQDFPLLESTVTFLLAWMSFFLAEEIGLSGIASILFCGIIDAHYSFNNLSEKSQHLTKEWIHLTAFVSETFVFVYLGLAAFSFTHSFKWKLILLSLLLCLISRALNIFPLSFVHNRLRNEKMQISSKYQFVFWFAGLRGAIAFALSIILEDENSNILMSTTLTIVFFTVFVLGGFTNPLLKKLDLAFKDEDEPLYKQQKKTRFLEFDKKYLKPLFTHQRYGQRELESLTEKTFLIPVVKYVPAYHEFQDESWKIKLENEQNNKNLRAGFEEDTELEDI
ncbi:sodium/hydrogen exchanger [Anaeramoeba flamelloides]|uniref:Sodium/hydrogen exchanger n=1 Tax=Anaeramoeba flamelloides TaxID=1746091 RepID=A0AAV7YIW3_9EUKA|nr:sodium/hydrogen exchanger [Anaeramoeba flamelloides]KAJ6228624.1 sodium/hydrogen exchanger [Anaeramoeba flamelloides]